MRTCKVLPLTSFELASHLDDYLTSEQKARGNKQWCFKDDKYYYYHLAYGKQINTVCFNQQAYTNILNNNTICSNVNLYKSINDKLPLYNQDSWYAIQIFDNNIHTNTCVVSISDNGSYHCAYSADNTMERWDSEIPEIYKEQVKYVQGEPYYPSFIQDDNIKLEDNKLFVHRKEINDFGYYSNMDDMFKFDNFGICEIHLPFNIINLNHEFIRQQLNTVEAHSYRIVGDNKRLYRKCDNVVLVNGSCFDLTKLETLPKFSIIEDSNSIISPYNIFNFNKEK